MNNKTKLNNPKSVNNENIKIGNTISQSFESKLKISILQFIRKMSKITMKVGGFLNNCASVCVWHLFPLLSSLEVRLFFILFLFHLSLLQFHFILFCFCFIYFHFYLISLYFIFFIFHFYLFSLHFIFICLLIFVLFTVFCGF